MILQEIIFSNFNPKNEHWQSTWAVGTLDVLQQRWLSCVLWFSLCSQPGVIVAWRDMLRSVQVLGHYRYRLLDFCSLGSFDRSIV